MKYIRKEKKSGVREKKRWKKRKEAKVREGGPRMQKRSIKLKPHQKDLNIPYTHPIP